VKKNILKLLIVVTIMLTTVSANAQAVVTEYFTMQGAFNLNPKDKRTQKIVATKGILSIEFNADKRILAITYSPKETVNVKEVMDDLKKVAATPN
jgi:uncharacterized membrane protein YciS (DUF1049 family)